MCSSDLVVPMTAAMRDAALIVVPMTVEMPDAVLHLKVAVVTPIAAPALDPTNVVRMPVVPMIDAMRDAVLHLTVAAQNTVAARKALSQDADLPQACPRRSTCWTETMMARSAVKKSCTASRPLMPTTMAT